MCGVKILAALLLSAEGWTGLADAKAAQGCCITGGPSPRQGFTEAVEILFDDGSEDPYPLHMDMATVERIAPGPDHQQRRRISRYVHNHVLKS